MHPAGSDLRPSSHCPPSIRSYVAHIAHLVHTYTGSNSLKYRISGHNRHPVGKCLRPSPTKSVVPKVDKIQQSVVTIRTIYC